MCITKKELEKKVEEIRSLKALKEQTEQEIKSLENEVIAFLVETEECKTTDKKGNPILQYIGTDYKATYAERSRENVNKEKVKAILSKEEFEKVLSKSHYNVLTIK